MNRNYFFSNSFKISAYKTLIYGSTLFLLIIAQCTFFAKLLVFSAIPDLALCALITVSMKENEKVTAVFATASGFLSCAIGGSDNYIYILFSFACGYLFWNLSSKTLANNLPSFIAYISLAMCAKGVFDLILGAIRAENFYFFNTLWRAVVPEFFCTLLFSVPIYYLFKALSSAFIKKHLQKGAKR